MPHVTVKFYPGKTDEQKARLAERIVKDVVETLGVDEKWVSVSVEEVSTEEWTDKVYTPDIQNTPGKLYRKPGYGPLADGPGGKA
jgi:4-oxalocrotonate tautomerase